MKEIRLESRVKNNRLFRLINARYRSVKEFCDANKIDYTICGLLMTFRYPAYYLGQKKKAKFGQPTQWAVRIAAALEREIEYVFPPELYRLSHRAKINSVAFELGIKEAKMLGKSALSPKEIGWRDVESAATKFVLRAEVESVMSTIPEREALVVAMRFGLGGEEPKTYVEIGKELGVSSTRAMQIAEAALCRLRHPARSKPLEGCL